MLPWKSFVLCCVSVSQLLLSSCFNFFSVHQPLWSLLMECNCDTELVELGQSSQWPERPLCNLAFFLKALYYFLKSREQMLFLRAFFCLDDWQAHFDEFLKEGTIVYLCSLPESLWLERNLCSFGQFRRSPPRTRKRTQTSFFWPGIKVLLLLDLVL